MSRLARNELHLKAVVRFGGALSWDPSKMHSQNNHRSSGSNGMVSADSSFLRLPQFAFGLLKHGKSK